MDAGQDLHGKTMVVTGATAGIGLGALQALAGRGAFVIGVGRSAERCAAARQAALQAHPQAQLAFCLADLASLAQVRRLAGEIAALVQARGGGLDVLLNNAGAVSSYYTATEDGYELQFAVNHLAPFLLTHELLPLLQQARFGRVVTVSSMSHYHGRMHWDDVMLRRFYHNLRAYQQSKLANVLFTVELNRRLGPDARLRAYAADPGLVKTDIGGKGTNLLERLVWRWRASKGQSIEEGASTPVFLAADPSVEASQEPYWKYCRPKPASPRALDPADAARLWALSERLTGVEGWPARGLDE